MPFTNDPSMKFPKSGNDLVDTLLSHEDPSLGVGTPALGITAMAKRGIPKAAELLYRFFNKPLDPMDPAKVAAGQRISHYVGPKGHVAPPRGTAFPADFENAVKRSPLADEARDGVDEFYKPVSTHRVVNRHTRPRAANINSANVGIGSSAMINKMPEPPKIDDIELIRAMAQRSNQPYVKPPLSGAVYNRTGLKSGASRMKPETIKNVIEAMMGGADILDVAEKLKMSPGTIRKIMSSHSGT